MNIIAIIFGILCAGAVQAATVTAAPADACAQIKARIAARTGLPQKPDTDLLRQIGTHHECGFSTAEAYRAAFGDRPLPKDEPRQRHRKHHDDDDD